MADGSVKFDTAIDSSGLRSGLAGLGKVALAGVGAAAAAIAALGTAAIKAGIDFESAFAGVKKTVDATDEQLNNLRKDILDMSKEIPLAATEIAGIAEAAGQLGIKTEAISEFTRTMADLGVATNLTSEEAATSLAKLANITQMPQDKFDELGSTVVALGNNLATTEADIVSMSLRLAGTGKQVGMTEDQILSLAGAASSVGLAAELGGSAFSRVLGMMQLAAAKGGDQLQGFANVAGMTGEQFKKAFEEDAAGALVKFIEGLGEAEASGKSAIEVISELGDIDGLSTLDTVAVRDALLRAAGASEVFAESLEIGAQAWDENNALTKEAEQRYATLESRLVMMKNSASSLGIAVYEGLKGPLGEVVSYATEAMNQLEAAFSEGGFSGLISTLGTVLGEAVTEVANAAPMLVEAAVELISGFVTALTDNSGTIIEAVAQIGLVLVEGFTTLAPQLLMAGGQIVYQLLEGIVSNVPMLMQGAGDALVSFADGFATNFPIVVAKGAELLKKLGEGIAKNLPSLVSKALEALMTFATTLYNSAPTIIQTGFDLLMNLVRGIINCLPELIAKGPEIISKFANIINDNFPTILMKGVELLWELIKGIISVIPDLIANAGKIVTAIWDVITAVNWVNLGKNIITWFKDGIVNMFGAVKGAATNVNNKIIEVITALPKKLLELGKNAISSMGNGIKGMASSAANAGKSVITGVLNVIKGFASQFVTAGKNMLLGLGDGIANAVGSVVSKAKQAAQRILSTVKNFFGIRSPSRLFRDVIGKNLMFGLAEGIEDETSTALASMGKAAKEIGGVEFTTKGFEIDNPEALYAKVNGVVNEKKAETTQAKAAEANTYTTGEGDTNTDTESSRPQFVQNDIYVDGRKTARILTPYVAKELEWEGK